MTHIRVYLSFFDGRMFLTGSCVALSVRDRCHLVGIMAACRKRAAAGTTSLSL